LLRFLRLFNIVGDTFVQPALRLPVCPKQRIVRVTEAVVAKSTGFHFNKEYKGLEVVPKKGDIVATDGEHTIRVPYDNTVLVMPSTSNVKVGSTTVRFGQFED
jgi:hypothetical protein